MHETINKVETFIREFNHGRKYTHLKKLKVGQCHDVYLSSTTGDVRLNTNIKAHIGRLDEMSWGFKGAGPYTLALNILYTFTGDETFANAHALDFRTEFLEKIDRNKNYLMPSFMITNWIDQKMKGEEIYG